MTPNFFRLNDNGNDQILKPNLLFYICIYVPKVDWFTQTPISILAGVMVSGGVELALKSCSETRM